MPCMPTEVEPSADSETNAMIVLASAGDDDDGTGAGPSPREQVEDAEDAAYVVGALLQSHGDATLALAAGGAEDAAFEIWRTLAKTRWCNACACSGR